jgi:hypothetical protein
MDRLIRIKGHPENKKFFTDPEDKESEEDEDGLTDESMMLDKQEREFVELDPKLDKAQRKVVAELRIIPLREMYEK